MFVVSLSLSLWGGLNDKRRDPHIDLIPHLLSAPTPSLSQVEASMATMEAIRSLSNGKGGGGGE